MGIRMIRRLLLLICMLAAAAGGAVEAHAQKRLVVIDAGHGGVDPGARGPGGLLEKTVALQVANRLAVALRTDPDLEVRLTRSSDQLIPLAERPRLANRWRNELGAEAPALFISIHANAHNSRSVRGVETYFLSEALTEDARRVAALENSAQRFESAAGQGDELAFILNDLRQNHYLRESSDVAAMIQDRLRRVYTGPNRGVKQAGFVVLEGSFMPAVLVELGFITNPEEEKLLASPEYQREITNTLVRAVSDFFAR